MADDTTSKLYRYKDDQGEIILSNQVPPDQASRGYEILNKTGQVEQTIAPALTQEQRDQKLVDEARKENDNSLRSLYSSYDEIDKARDVQIGKIKSDEVVTNGSINAFVAKRESIQTNAADLERKGQKVPDNVSKDLFNIEYHIKTENKKLQDLKDLEAKTLAKFASDRVRLGELLNLGGPTQIPETQLRPLSEASKP